MHVQTCEYAFSQTCEYACISVCLNAYSIWMHIHASASAWRPTQPAYSAKQKVNACVYTNVNMHAYSHVCMYTCIQLLLLVGLHLAVMSHRYMYACLSIYKYICIYMQILHTRKYIRLCVHISTCFWSHILIHANILYIFTNVWTLLQMYHINMHVYAHTHVRI